MTGGWAYNSLNQVTNAPARTLLPGATTLTYDAAGNLTRADQQAPHWNGLGQMDAVNPTTAGASTPVIAYTYDVLGRRATKSVNGALVKRYLYDGMLLIAEADGQTGQTTASYTWGAQGLVSDRVAGNSRFYLFDPQGNCEYLIGANNTTVWAHGRWTAYGSRLGTSTPPTPFAWKGQFGAYTDSDTDLVKMGARDYAPSIGRFISRDPSGYAGGTNVYAFCGGDPVNLYDPDGQFGHIIAGAVIGGVVGAGTDAFFAWYGGASSEEIWRAAGRGAFKGAVTGAVIAALGPAAGACAGWGTAIGVGAGTGALNSLMTQGFAVYDGTQDSLNWKMLFQDTLMGGLMKGIGMLCFDGDTPVQVASQVAVLNPVTGRSAKGKTLNTVKMRYVSKTKRIQDIKSGDIVAARDIKSGKSVWRRVKEAFKRTSDHLIVIALADKSGRVVESVKTTRQHPFFVSGKGFVPAGGLALGNAIVTRAGPALRVRSIKWQRRSEGYTVYNFEVEAASESEDTHNYFVGRTSGGILVHNGDYHLFSPLTRRAITNSQYRSIPGVPPAAAARGIGSGNVNGIPIKPSGYPDFSGNLYTGTTGGNSVRIAYSGARATDFARANAAAGFRTTPAGFTWHHAEDWNPMTNMGTMELVETAAHESARHNGGVSLWQAVNNATYQ